MKLSTSKSIIKYFLLLILFSVSVISAQEISVNGGVDIVNRYNWRGLEVNDNPNLQPALSLSFSGFTLGFWGSYAISSANDAKAATELADEEIDLYLSYVFATNAGDFGVLLTDYYFPDLGIPLGFYHHQGGAHVLEMGLTYNGPESFPINIFAGYNFYNDPGKNTYFEVSYPFSLNGVDLSLFAGGTGGSKDNPIYYGTDKFALLRVGITGSKSISLSENFELPLSVSYIVNPNADIAQLIFGTGLHF